MMSINGVKGVEIGAGFGAASFKRRGERRRNRHRRERHADILEKQRRRRLGGISTGQDLIVRFAVKPTSSILAPRKTIDKDGNDTEISTKGRHDPCVGIRAVPVGEAMMASVLADHMLRHRAQCGG